MVLPHQTTLKSQIDERLDLETIQRRFENAAADPQEFIQYFLDMMSNLCAQCRDENITKLRSMTDPTETFRYVDEFLMKNIERISIDLKRNYGITQSDEIGHGEFQYSTISTIVTTTSCCL